MRRTRGFKFKHNFGKGKVLREIRKLNFGLLGIEIAITNERDRESEMALKFTRNEMQ
jgi:hypothetical protein